MEVSLKAAALAVIALALAQVHCTNKCNAKWYQKEMLAKHHEKCTEDMTDSTSLSLVSTPSSPIQVGQTYIIKSQISSGVTPRPLAQGSTYQVTGGVARVVQ